MRGGLCRTGTCERSVNLSHDCESKFGGCLGIRAGRWVVVGDGNVVVGGDGRVRVSSGRRSLWSRLSEK
jgi:hypothetical protein